MQINRYISEHCANTLVEQLGYKPTTEQACSSCGVDTHVYWFKEEPICSCCILLNKKLPRSDKDGELSIKQLDTILIIQPSQSFILGRVKAPSSEQLTVLCKSESGLKERDFIADFLMNKYDKSEPLLLVWQSKADKFSTFQISQGDVVQLSGAETRIFNTKKVRAIAEQIDNATKRPKIREYIYHLDRLAWLNEETESKLVAATHKKIATIEKANPDFVKVKAQLPLKNSDDAELLAWCFG